MAICEDGALAGGVSPLGGAARGGPRSLAEGFTIGHDTTKGFVGTCPTPLFRTGRGGVFDCAGATNEERVDLGPSSEVTACTLPRGTIDLDVRMESGGVVDTYILCVEPCGAGGHDKKEIIDWNSGLISDRKNRLHKTLTVAHDGVKYSYAGDDRGTVGGVVEYVNITGTTPYALRLHFRNNGRTRNKEYKYRGFDHADCGASGLVDCELCSAYP